jgi:5-methylthioribose kinase
MITRQIVRRFSTRSIVDKWFNALESRTHEEQQSKLAQCIEYSLQHDQSIYSNFIRDIIHRWAIEQPTTEALWTYEVDHNDYQKLTFNDIYTQSSHFADILTGNQFNLTSGKRVCYLK